MIRGVQTYAGHVECFSKAFHICLCCLICLGGLVEEIYGLLQLAGCLPSLNPQFPLTGHFSNPGPYGGFVAMAVAVAFPLWFHADGFKARLARMLSRSISVVTAVLGFIILPATLSRASWLALGVAAIVYLFLERNFVVWVKRRKSIAVIVAFLLSISLSGAFFLKKESAIGRFHIWHMELRAIAKKPIAGYGKGRLLGVYGETQAEYFAEKERPETIKKVAGCPEYAFNEYLRVGVEYGVPAMIGVLATLGILIFALFKFRSPLSYGVIVFAVFSFFSYPLESLHIKSEAEKEYESIRYLSNMGLYEEAFRELEPLSEDLSDNFRYLYDCGYALYKSGRYEEGLDYLKRGSAISSDPMFHNIMGRCYESLGLFEEAESEYIHSSYMVPQRLYPLILLMRMHISLGNDDAALHYAGAIMEKPVNPKHRTMLELKEEASKYIDSKI